MVVAGAFAAALAHATASNRPQLLGNRALFRPDACRGYPPTGTANGDTVLLDAGHGGLDQGTHGTTPGGTTVLERDAALDTARRVAARLRSAGYRVVMTRTDEGTVARIPPADVSGSVYTVAGVRRDLRARLACAHVSGADAFVSIHYDSATDPAAGGATTYYDPDRSFAAANRRLAADVQAGLVASYRRAGWSAIPDRGVVPDDRGAGGAVTAAARAYGHLFLLGPRAPGFNERPSTMPGALTEPLFLTDPPEAAIAASPHGRAVVARGIAAGIQRFLHG